MDIKTSHTIFKDKMDKKYLKLKHKVYKRICKRMEKGKTSYTLKRPMFIEEAIFYDIIFKIRSDFEKLGIQSCIGWYGTVFDWR